MDFWHEAPGVEEAPSGIRQPGWSQSPISEFRIVVEGKTPTDEYYLYDPPSDLMTLGKRCHQYEAERQDPDPYLEGGLRHEEKLDEDRNIRKTED